MSSAIFPALRGARAYLLRSDSDGVEVLETVSRREQRISRSSVPVRTWGLRHAWLRGDATNREVQRLLGFWSRHRGRLDSFLFRDPEDYQVTDHGIGVGDGVTTSFQLQRAVLAPWEDALGNWETYTKPRVNRIWHSNDITQAAWAKLGTAAATRDGTLAPDGTQATKLTGIGTVLVNQIAQGSNGSHGSGASVGWGCYVRRVSTTGTLVIGRITDAAALATIDLSTIGDGWVRYSGVGTANGAGQHGFQIYATAGAPLSFYLAHMQCEDGVPTRPIVTAGANVTATPAYWPGVGDGFEPVWEPDWASIKIYLEGVEQSASTWSPGTAGQVVFAGAPASGSKVSWSGSYWRRVRFDDEALTQERLLAQLWSGELRLREVVP
jgi:hypothetical protein